MSFYRFDIYIICYTSKWLTGFSDLWPGCDPGGAGNRTAPPCFLRDHRIRRRSSSRRARPPAVAHSCGSPPCWPSSLAYLPGRRWGPSGRSPPPPACPELAGPDRGWGSSPPSPPLWAAPPQLFPHGLLWRTSWPSSLSLSPDAAWMQAFPRCSSWLSSCFLGTADVMRIFW